jgi:mRNA interferase RelE/StbE
MPKEVLLSTPAQKAFKALDGSTRDRVRKSLKRLAETGTGDVKKLAGVKGRAALFRLRVGDFRVIFQNDPDAIRVIQIFHRGKGYDWLE